MRIQEEMNWNRKVTRSSCHVNLYDLSTEMRMKKKEKCIEVFKSHESDLSSRILAHAMQFIFQHPLKFIPFVCILLHRSLPRDPRGEVNDRREKFIRQTTIKTVFPFFVSSLSLSLILPSRETMFLFPNEIAHSWKIFTRELNGISLEAFTNLNAFDNPRLIHPNEIKIFPLSSIFQLSSCPLDPHREIAIRNRMVEKFE